MTNQNEHEVPKIFMSYSHDSPAHKKWVGELASKLVDNGIDVIFDQWDLGLGDDVPKFMEKAVSEADRVLMVCTETYVNKANAGKGGVGYEAMVVTGELIQNLGTSKFIPVIRQLSKEPILPKAVSTRFYINLSEDQNFGEQFGILLRELHQVPAITKPPLGKNPFAKQPSGTEIPIKVETESLIPDISQYNKDIANVYKTALNVARQGDIVAWRKIVRQAKEPIQDGLNKWTNDYAEDPPKGTGEMYSAALQGLVAYEALISVALAGVESGREKFSNQIALIDEILMPRNWDVRGYPVTRDFPKSVTYVYQALHGATCLMTNQISLAVRLARAKITLPIDNKTLPFYLHYDIVGWPSSLGNESNDAYNFIKSLPDKWNWLYEIFGSSDEFRESLCAYYMVLSIIEFVGTLAGGKEQILEQEQIGLDIPLCFLEEDRDIKQRAYRMIINDPDDVKAIWLNLGVENTKVNKYWPLWIKHVGYWLTKMHSFGIRSHIDYENLPNDLE